MTEEELVVLGGAQFAADGLSPEEIARAIVALAARFGIKLEFVPVPGAARTVEQLRNYWLDAVGGIRLKKTNNEYRLHEFRMSKEGVFINYSNEIYRKGRQETQR